MSLGALAVTGNLKKRRAAGVELNDVTVVPFDGRAITRVRLRPVPTAGESENETLPHGN